MNIFCRYFGYSSHRHLCTFQKLTPVLKNIQENQQVSIISESLESSEDVTHSNLDKNKETRTVTSPHTSHDFIEGTPPAISLRPVAPSESCDVSTV